MSRIIRTVSLDKLSDELAGNKPNFSAWVRDALKTDNNERTHIHATLSIFKARGLCNPSASPRCGLCFPVSRPPASAIREYNNSKIYGRINQRTEEEQAEAVGKLLAETLDYHKNKEDSTILDGDILEKNDPSPPHLRERKYVRRALKWVINFI